MEGTFLEGVQSWLQFQGREWLHLFLRWFHIIAGIAWLGSTWLFNWFERRLEETVRAGENTPEDEAGPVFMVHGGGFFYVKKQMKPTTVPGTLHWFKWEAMLTWLSGMALLVLVYYMGGAMIDGASPVGAGAAALIGLGSLVVGFAIYEGLLRSPLGRSGSAFAVVCLVLVVAGAYALNAIFAGRAAFFHVGAIFGTIMVANVWMKIIPGQREMVRALEAGREPDLSYGARGKQASGHNTYMALPLILIMISSHFPTTTYAHPHMPLVLGGLMLVGWAGAAWMRDDFARWKEARADAQRGTGAGKDAGASSDAA
jgi:uncharacterized membrane protein